MIETLEQIGEEEILNRLKRFMDVGQIDDDTALIKSSNKEFLINTDVLVENIHFSEETISPQDIGWKAITTNLSDLYSSGTDNIVGFTVGLIAPPSTSWNWVNEVYTGMQQALYKYGGKLLGGDCSKGREKILSITAIGTLGTLRLHRAHAKPGDSLVASGPHGLSKLGLELLLSKSFDKLDQLSPSIKSQAINAHQRPQPPLQALKELQKCKPSNLDWRAAGTDSSDGLLQAINSLCISSNCQAVINYSNLPKAQDWPQGTKWDNWCLNGGEDYELVVSLPEDWANAWIGLMPACKKIGFMQSGLPKVIWDNGKEINNLAIPNFKHF